MPHINPNQSPCVCSCFPRWQLAQLPAHFGAGHVGPASAGSDKGMGSKMEDPRIIIVAVEQAASGLLAEEVS